MPNKLPLSIFILCFSFMLPGCGSLFTPRIDDLKLVSVSMVNLADHPEVEWHGMKRPSMELIEITFASQFDLLAVARDYDFHLSSWIFYCDSPSSERSSKLGHFYGIYSDDLESEITDYTWNDKIFLKPDLKGVYEYRIYMEYLVNSQDNPFSSKSVKTFDTHAPLKDLCSKIRGANMLRMYFDTNIILIPKNAILNAIGKY